MDAESLNIKTCFARIEVFVLNLSFCVAVQCVTVLGTKLLYVKAGGSRSDFLIGSKSNADRPVWNIFCLQTFNQSKNLGNSCLVVSSKDGGAVTGNQRAPCKSR